MHADFEDYLLHDVRVQAQLMLGDADWIADLAGDGGVYAGEADVTELLCAIRQHARMICDLLTPLLEAPDDMQITILSPYAKRIADTIAQSSRASGRRFIYEFNGEPVAAIVPVAFERMLYNVLSNAIRHSPANASVVMRVMDVDGCAVVEVANKGEPFDSQVSDALFGRQSGREERSAGMGLDIVRVLADEMRCTLRAESKDGWNTISIQFPGEFGG